MGKISDYLNTTKGAPPPNYEGGGTVNLDYPKVGCIVTSPHNVLLENGIQKYDQLALTSGLTVSEVTHPLLYAYLIDLQGSAEILPVADLVTGIQYRIIADLT